MILQSLVSYYEALAAKGLLSRPGWGPAKVSYAIYLDDSGDISGVVSLQEEQERGKKKILAPRIMTVPAPVKRSANVASNFLCDNSGYILGVSDKGKPERVRECFEACKTLHEELLSDVDSDVARILKKFFAAWNPANAADHPVLKDVYNDIIKGANIVFRINGSFAQDDAGIADAWQRYYDSDEGKSSCFCLVTGKEGTIAQLHPSIRGITGAQSSGASLVSFNAPSSCSYNHEQGTNAPTSEYAAFAYGAALNYLISDREHTSYIGDTIVLCWAANANDEYQSAFCSMMFGKESSYTANDLRGMMKSLCEGRKVDFDDSLLDPDMDFYILGIAPNSARLSVRFFYHNSFGSVIRNVNEHYDRLEIVKPAYDKFDILPMWKLLSETVNQNSKDKSPSPLLGGEMLRAILTGTPYPAALINGVALRIRAEHEISRGKAATIKAYYLKNTNTDVPKEVLTVTLNTESGNLPYVLGRLFAVLEAIQEKANPGINATIKDKYFNSASATPAVIFPILINLAQKHLKKIDGGMKVYYEKQLVEIMSCMEDNFPAHLNLPQQGAFQLGYYHQTQARYQRKDKEEN